MKRYKYAYRLYFNYCEVCEAEHTSPVFFSIKERNKVDILMLYMSTMSEGIHKEHLKAVASSEFYGLYDIGIEDAEFLD